MEDIKDLHKQTYDRLNALGITVYNEDGTYRPFLDVLEEIFEKWDNMK